MDSLTHLSDELGSGLNLSVMGKHEERCKESLPESRSNDVGWSESLHQQPWETTTYESLDTSAGDDSIGTVSSPELLPDKKAALQELMESGLPETVEVSSEEPPLHVKTLKAPTPQVYSEWSATYEQDAHQVGYRAPQAVAEEMVKLFDEGHFTWMTSVKVLDVGAGPGNGAEAYLSALQVLPQKATLDACDYAPGMVEKCRSRNLYHHCFVHDLMKDQLGDTGLYDLMCMVGVLIPNNVDHTALGNIAKGLAPGGFLLATIRNHLWEECDTLYMEQFSHCGLHLHDVCDIKYTADYPAKLLIVRRSF